MRLAIPTWNGRISPVFDVAKHLLLVDLDKGQEAGREEAVLEGTDVPSRAGRIAELRVDTLICGAISRALEARLAAAGVYVIPDTRGLIEEVLNAYSSDRLTEQAFLMPGCCDRRQRSKQRRRRRGSALASNQGDPT